MHFTSRTLLICLSTLLSFSANAAFSGRPVLSTTISVADADSNRAGPSQDNNGFGIRLGLAKEINSRLMLELQLGSIEYSDNNNDKLRQINAGLELQTLLRTSGKVRPYILLGTGTQRTDVSSNNSEFQNSYADLGLGLFHILNEHGLSVRMDVRLRRDFFDDPTVGTTDYDDFIANVGISIPLGGSAESKIPYIEETSYQRSEDEDADGVQNTSDYCPDTAIGHPVDVNGCSREQSENGVPASVPTTVGTEETSPVINDADQDGVEDALDSCSRTNEGMTVDERGCSDYQAAQRTAGSDAPATVTPPAPITTTPVIDTTPNNYNISFVNGSDQLDASGQQELNRLARALLHRKELSASILSGAANNQNLAYRRGKAISRGLSRFGVNKQRLTISTDTNNESSVVRLKAK